MTKIKMFLRFKLETPLASTHNLVGAFAMQEEKR